MIWVESRRLWRFCTSVVDPHTGAVVRICGEARDPLEAERRQRKNVLRREVKWGIRDPDDLRREDTVFTVAEWMDVWLEGKRDLRDSTRQQYARLIRLHINEAFGTTALRMLTSDTVRKFIDVTMPNKINPKTGRPLREGSTPRAVYWVLNDAFEEARVRQHIFKNPLEGIDAPKKQGIDKTERDAVKKLYPWVGKHLLGKIEGERDEARWALAFYGMRQSEVLGLTDDCVKDRNGRMTLIIKQQLKKKHQAHGCEWVKGAWSCGAKVANKCPQVVGERGVFIDTTTKTDAGEREIAVDDWLRGVIRRHMKRQKELRASEGFSPDDGAKMDRLLFTQANGRARRHTADNAAWHKLLEVFGVYDQLRRVGFDDSFRPHLARHITASLLLARGYAPEEIKMLTGWSSGEMIRIYGNAGAEPTTRMTASIGRELSGRQREIN